MAKVSTGSQINYWGRLAPTGYGLDPQRSDLWFADFTSAVLGLRAIAVNGAANDPTDIGQLIINGTPAIMPQLVKSVTMPDTRIRAEVVRRSSLPFQVPSWDDPYEPIRVQFIADVPDDDSVQRFSPEAFLKIWSNVVRIGRGFRRNGGPGTTDTLRLVENTDGGLPLPNFRYDFSVFLLKGVSIQNGLSAGVGGTGVLAGLRQASVRAATSLANAVRRPDALFAADTGFGNTLDGRMSVATTVTFRNAWPVSYKMSDLTYDAAGLVVFDAAFHVESITYTDGSSWT